MKQPARGYRGFASREAYENHYSDPKKYKHELQSMQDYSREAEEERRAMETEYRLGVPLEERAAKALCEYKQLRAYGRVLTSWRSPEMATNYIELQLNEVRIVLAVADTYRQEVHPGFDSRANPDPISG